ncbi:unnamed protein product, partial [Polarella glacialis]
MICIACDPARSVVFALCLAMLSVHVLILIRTCRCPSFKWRQLVHRAGALLKQQDSPDLVSTCVSVQMGIRRVTRLRKAIFTISNIQCILPLVEVVKIVWEPDGEHGIMSQSQWCLLLSTWVLATIVNVCPSILQKCRVELVFSLSMASLTVFVILSGNSGRQVMFSEWALFPFRLVLNLAYFRPRSAAFWNLLHMLTTTYVYAGVKVSACDMLDLRSFVIFELATCAFVMGLVCGMERVNSAELRREIEGRAMNNQSLAARSLLRIVCDIVIELDSELALTENVPGLSAILMMTSGRSTKGTPLHHFIPDEEDKAQLKQKMCSSSEEPNQHAGAFHTRLMDSFGSIICVEIFHVKYERIDEKAHYLVGLREFADVPPIVGHEIRHPSDFEHYSAAMSEVGGDSLSDAFIGMGDGATATATLAAKPTTTNNNDDATITGSLAGTPHTAQASPESKGGGKFPMEQPHVSSSELIASALCRKDELIRRQELAAASGDWQRSSVSSFKSQERLSFPELRSTRPEVHDFSILDAMQAWNLHIPRKVCCPFHAHVLELRACVKRFGRSQCSRCFPLPCPPS